MIQKILFFFFVFVIAFIPGGIFISVFLLSLYYLVPLFLENKEKNSKNYKIYAFRIDNPPNIDSFEKIKSYSKNTLEEMK